jgi:hypothetical protein
MGQGRKIGTLARSTALGVALLMAGAPAEAGFRGLRPGFAVPAFAFSHFGGSRGGAGAAGLIGGLALGMVTAAASRATAVEIPIEEYGAVPYERTAYSRLDEEWREPRVSRPMTHPLSQPRPSDGRRSTVARPTAALDACGEAIARAASRYGESRVSLTHASPERTDARVKSLKFDASVEYRKSARRQVRKARVTCLLGDNGQVVAVRLRARRVSVGFFGGI